MMTLVKVPVPEGKPEAVTTRGNSLKAGSTRIPTEPSGRMLLSASTWWPLGAKTESRGCNWSAPMPRGMGADQLQPLLSVLAPNGHQVLAESSILPDGSVGIRVDPAFKELPLVVTASGFPSGTGTFTNVIIGQLAGSNLASNLGGSTVVLDAQLQPSPMVDGPYDAVLAVSVAYTGNSCLPSEPITQQNMQGSQLLDRKSTRLNSSHSQISYA